MAHAALKLSQYPLVEEMFDEDGFLEDPGSWNMDLANHIAHIHNIELDRDEHWQVLNFMRDRFERIGGIPAMRHICRGTGLEREQIYQLFGGCLTVWYIAGLPNPGEEARAYL